MRAKRGLKGTWPQALVSFFVPILLVLGVRWAIIEPYVIPSGSMIPNLLVHDHVFVQKFAFGLRLPFSEDWLIHWADPKPGDIVVFRYPENPEVFFIKRLIGVPGDHISVEGGKISVNGIKWSLEDMSPVNLPDSDQFNYEIETAGAHSHVVRFSKQGPRDPSLKEWTLSKGEYFMMGDNRDESSDSRIWGTVPEKNLVGKAWLIWLSCDEMLESARFICDPSTMRWGRVFKSLTAQ